MQNKISWKPSKFIYKKDKLIASRDIKEVSISSRLIADLIARFYDSCLHQYAKGHLLDLGCGKVPLYEAYKNFVTDVTCIDWENSLHENIYLDKFADLNKTLPINDNQFETLILSDVLEHIKEPRLLWCEMNRVLKKEGILLLNVPFYYWLHEEPHDYYRYTKYALDSMANESGFNIIKIEPLGGVPEILTDIFSKIIIKIPLVGNIAAIFLHKVAWLFINTKIGKKISTTTSNKFPLGYILIAQKL